MLQLFIPGHAPFNNITQSLQTRMLLLLPGALGREWALTSKSADQACTQGHVALLDYFWTHQISPTAHGICKAMDAGHTGVITWVEMHGEVLEQLLTSSAIKTAVCNGCVEAVDWMYRHGVPLYAQLAHVAISHGHEYVMEYLFDKQCFAATPASMETAVLQGFHTIVRHLHDVQGWRVPTWVWDEVWRQGNTVMLDLLWTYKTQGQELQDVAIDLFTHDHNASKSRAWYAQKLASY